MSPMKILSFNVKGLSNPSKVKKVETWPKQEVNLEAVILREIKCVREELLQRFKDIDNQLKWVNTSHQQGSGGLACGLSNNWSH